MWTEIWKRQYLWGIKLSLFSPSARKNINLHYIIIIMIKTSMFNHCVLSTPQWKHYILQYIYYIQAIYYTGGTLKWHWQSVSWQEERKVSPYPPHTGQQLFADALLWWILKTDTRRSTHTNPFRGEMLQQWKVRWPGDDPDSSMAIGWTQSFTPQIISTHSQRVRFSGMFR